MPETERETNHRYYQIRRLESFLHRFHLEPHSPLACQICLVNEIVNRQSQQDDYDLLKPLALYEAGGFACR